MGKGKTYITRYGVVVTPDKVDRLYKKPSVDYTSKVDFNKMGVHLAEHYKNNMLRHLEFTGYYGTAIIYAVRTIGVYVLSLNGFSRIFSSNEKLYNYLVEEEIVKGSKKLNHQFKEYCILDFDAIVRITGGRVKSLPYFSYMFNETDVYEKKLPGGASITFVPALHEEKIVVEILFKTDFLTEEITQQIIKLGMKKIRSSYILPPVVWEEAFQGLEF